MGMAHDAGDSLAAGQNALVYNFGTDARHAISGVTPGMGRFNVRQQHDVGRNPLARRATLPVVVTAGGDFEVFAHGIYG